MSAPFTVGIIQDDAVDDTAKNVEAAVGRIREAASRGAQIICLKELFNAPYFCKSQQCERFDLAETIPGPTTDVMQKIAKELGVVLIVPIFEKQARGVYRNSAAIIDADGSMLGVYRKMHIPDDPLFNEKYYFTPGDAHQDERGTTPSSFAIFCMTSVVGPGIGSARSKRSHCCDLQKYGALNSSLRQMICAPREAASRMRPTAASTFLAASSTASS